jgi:hypothetical protein
MRDRIPHRRRQEILARLRAHALERRMAGGEDPTADPLLACRAAQLARPRMRESIARTIERTLHDARHPVLDPFSSAVPPCRSQVLPAEPALLALVCRLRDGLPLWPVGIARVRLMLTDSRSPLYAGARQGDVGDWAHSVLDELGGGFA